MKLRLPYAWIFLGLLLPSVLFAKNLTKTTAYTPETVPMFADSTLSQEVGHLEAGVPVKLLQTTAKASELELEMWRKAKGFGRVWYNQFAKQITDAVFSKEFVQNAANFEILESKPDPLTGLMWQKVKAKVWVENTEFIDSLTDFWAETKTLYQTECTVCHKLRDTKMHDSNQWIAVFNGMVGNTDLENAEQKQVLRYLQMHASDAKPAEKK